MTSQTFIALNTVLKAIANRAAMCCAYKSWSDDYCRTSLRKEWQRDSSFPAELNQETFDKLSVDELRALGFGLWSNDEPLWVIPLALWPLVPNGTELHCINGGTITKSDDTDLDNRFGCVAYGFNRGPRDAAG